MDPTRLTREEPCVWRLPATGRMRVPVVLYASEELVRQMDEKVCEQAANVATLPGIQQASYALPDAHWGYGFPVGGVAAFDPREGGVVSAGGVGFDISCGVRTMLTGIGRAEIERVRRPLAAALGRDVPAGVGSTGSVHLDDSGLEEMLRGGAAWAVGRGFGAPADLARIEEHGCMRDARPEFVSEQAKRRQRDEMGTLGSGNHYLELQEVAQLYDAEIARTYGLNVGEIVVTIHCGSRGLGHQIATDFMKEMIAAAAKSGRDLPDRELACAPIESDLGQRYLGAMRAGINCALANRQILTHRARRTLGHFFPGRGFSLLYDVSHNTCKVETHLVDGRPRPLHVHRKGATRAFGPGHADLPAEFRETGQPVLIGGSMGTNSFILAGTKAGPGRAFASAIHGAGRALSRHEATRRWIGREVVNELAGRGITLHCHSPRGVAAEAPGAYKDAGAVVEAAVQAGLAKRVARLAPVICVKG